MYLSLSHSLLPFALAYFGKTDNNSIKVVFTLALWAELLNRIDPVKGINFQRVKVSTASPTVAVSFADKNPINVANIYQSKALF